MRGSVHVYQKVIKTKDLWRISGFPWQVKQYGDPVDVLGIVNEKAGSVDEKKHRCLYLWLYLDLSLSIYLESRIYIYIYMCILYVFNNSNNIIITIYIYIYVCTHCT